MEGTSRAASIFCTVPGETRAASANLRKVSPCSRRARFSRSPNLLTLSSIARRVPPALRCLPCHSAASLPPTAARTAPSCISPFGYISFYTDLFPIENILTILLQGKGVSHHISYVSDPTKRATGDYPVSSRLTRGCRSRRNRNPDGAWRACRQQVAGRGRRDARDHHGSARHDDRERRAVPYPRQPVGRSGRGGVGAHLVYRRQCDHHSADQVARNVFWPQALLHLLDIAICRQ